MNEQHLTLCSSAEWAEAVQKWIIPWVLDGVDLGDDVLEVGPGPGLTTDVLHTMVGRLTAVEIHPELAEALGVATGRDERRRRLRRRHPDAVARGPILRRRVPDDAASRPDRRSAERRVRRDPPVAASGRRAGRAGQLGQSRAARPARRRRLPADRSGRSRRHDSKRSGSRRSLSIPTTTRSGSAPRRPADIRWTATSARSSASARTSWHSTEPGGSRTVSVPPAAGAHRRPALRTVRARRLDRVRGGHRRRARAEAEQASTEQRREGARSSRSCSPFWRSWW